MQFRFDPDLTYQNQAIEAVARLFEGTQPLEAGLGLTVEFGAVGNRLTIDDARLLANLQAV